MLGQIYSGSVIGTHGIIVKIEVSIGSGLTNFFTVGLAEGAVRESKTRVKSALSESGFAFPYGCVTLNLAPADIRKDGSAFDFPIALALLLADDILRPIPDIRKILFLGELSLDGSLMPVPGVLPICLKARAEGFEAIMLPEDNAREAAQVQGLRIMSVNNLVEAYEILQGRRTCQNKLPHIPDDEKQNEENDLRDVKGQILAKRSLEIAAAGGHNLLMAGPPGSGKTMLAKRLSGILPKMTFEESIEISCVYSVSGALRNGRLLVSRPFRSPHHTISSVGLVGGGTPVPRPGEISLAHHGVLFLDELPEFSRQALEVLRQPAEEGTVFITRRLNTVEFPCRFILVAAMNACPCGYLGSRLHRCTCKTEAILRYQSRISGPLLDRIDLQVEVKELKYDELMSADNRFSESSEQVRARVEAAREIQNQRYKTVPFSCNAHMDARSLEHFCKTDASGHRLLRRVVDELGFSARAYARLLKIARTIADLKNEADIRAEHLAEALSFRKLDLQFSAFKRSLTHSKS